MLNLAQRVPFALSDLDIAALGAAGRLQRFERRECFALEGTALAVVASGYFRIFRNAAFVRDVTLGLAGRGDILAPGNAFGDRVAENGVEACTKGELVLLSSEAWRERATAAPELHLKMAASLGRRLSRLQKRLEDLSRAGVASRVAGMLLELADDFGTVTPEGVRLEVPLSQADLARLAGTTRETCSTTVAGFVRKGFVAGRRLRGLVVRNRPGLERAAEGSS